MIAVRHVPPDRELIIAHHAYLRYALVRPGLFI